MLHKSAEITFHEINHIEQQNQAEYHPFTADFSYLRIKTDAILIFQDCDLRMASFAESNLARNEFYRVIWASRRGRTAIYDELIWRKTKQGSPEAVERIYLQLKSRYEEKQDYKRVGDFHCGEMEMHRLGMPLRGWGSWSWFY